MSYSRFIAIYYYPYNKDKNIHRYAIRGGKSLTFDKRAREREREREIYTWKGSMKDLKIFSQIYHELPLKFIKMINMNVLSMNSFNR